MAAERGDAAGWTRQQLQIPKGLAKRLRADAEPDGYGGLKTTGTAAVALWLALPESVREKLGTWVILGRRKPDELTPESAWQVFVEAMATAPNIEPLMRVVQPPAKREGAPDPRVEDSRAPKRAGNGR